MAQVTKVVLIYSAANLRRHAWYDAEQGRAVGSITYAIDPSSPVEYELASGEPDGGWPVPVGGVIEQFCEGTDGVTLYALHSEPYLRVGVDPTAAACSATQPVGCTLSGVAAWNAQTERVNVTVSGAQGAAQAARTYGGPYFPVAANGIIEFGTEDLPTGARVIYLKDAGIEGTPCRAEVVYNIFREEPEGPGTGHVDAFRYGPSETGTDVFLYYVSDQNGRRITITLRPTSGAVPTNLTEAERGRIEGELVRTFIEGSNRINLLASLDALFLPLR